MTKRKYTRIVAVCLLLIVLASLISILTGSYSISIPEIIRTFLGNGTKAQNFAIFQLRMPRIVLSLLVGAALAISGGVLQGITRNPLSEPGMVGINAGAALFVVVWIGMRSDAYFSALSASTVFFMPMLAMTGSLLAVTFIYLFAYRNGIHPVRFILTGVGVNAAINAVISYYAMAMSTGNYNEVLTWTNGSLWGSSWEYIRLVSPFVLIITAIILIKARTLDVIALGDELAQGLGVSVQKETLIFLVLSSVLAAVATAVAGNIAFLGLLGPQIAKKLTGPEHRKMLPVAAMISSAILILSDAVARNLFSPIEIPVGIVVSILGVPYFMHLMMKTK